MYLLRSMLFVPAHSDRFMESAAKSEADCLILDLEDSVPEDCKDQARKTILRALEQGFFGSRQLIVRLNSLDSYCVSKDIRETAHESLLGYMPSKIKSVGDIQSYSMLFCDVEDRVFGEKWIFKLLPLIETAEATFNVNSIASETERLIALCFGNEDLITDLHGESDEELRTLEVPRWLVCAAARAHDLEPIDTVFLDIKNLEGFRRRETFAKKLGYSGTLCLHPSQVAIANECFSPTWDDIYKAERIIDAVTEAKKLGRGITLLDGKVVGPPMIKKAHKIVEQSKLIKERYNE